MTLTGVAAPAELALVDALEASSGSALRAGIGTRAR